MFRFSCFYAPNHSHKSKKTIQHSVEPLNETLEACSLNQAAKDPVLAMRARTGSSGDLHAKDAHRNNFSVKVNRAGCLKKSQSLGSALCEAVEIFDSGLVVGDGGEDQGGRVPSNRSQEYLFSGSPQAGSSCLVNNETIFSIGDSRNLEREGKENSEIAFFTECVGDADARNHCRKSAFGMTSSLPNSGGNSPASQGGSFTSLPFRSRSSGDLHVLEIRTGGSSVHGLGTQAMGDKERYDNPSYADMNNCENPATDACDSFDYFVSAKDWIIPDEGNVPQNFLGESYSQQATIFPSKDFKVKRIEEWVNDLQHCCPLQETFEPSLPDDEVERGPSEPSCLIAAKSDSKIIPGMEAAKRYISSLNPAATTAQLANHGLVLIPFLSALSNLKVLNLSGNAIVRITAGVLPRGLHMLNLSKNTISVIEGLRELTRLRVLDLSYNRITRIGHGLASCSSLKELYLAGNKISEVEGLHRLLKLNVLDLRFNKISVTKCLGQLAANYISLQAISLEGNPAQKNVGDEQLKKYLSSLLPHLVYYNRQPIKSSVSKDAADRSVRIGAHQFNRSARSDHKTARKGSGTKATSSSTHGRKNPAMVYPKEVRSRHIRFPPPPSGTKAVSQSRHHPSDFGNKLLTFRQELNMRRSQSASSLAAL